MLKVFKYSLPTYSGLFSTPIPVGGKILKLGLQRTPVLWVLVDPQTLSQPRNFRFVETGGDEVSPFDEYIGTVTLPGEYVLHLFEVV